MTRTNPVYVYLELRMGGYVIPENGLKYNRVKIKIEHKLKLYCFTIKKFCGGLGRPSPPKSLLAGYVARESFCAGCSFHWFVGLLSPAPTGHCNYFCSNFSKR